MVYIAVISLIVGIFAGAILGDMQIIHTIDENSNVILILLMLSVGISVGLNKDVFRNIGKQKKRIFILPFGTVLGTLIGGVVSSLVLSIPMNYSLAMVSGLGWYSLTGVVVSDILGSDYGTIAFLCNLLREFLSFLLIPFLVKNFNKYTAIAPAGATSEDTTLPMLIKYTDEETVVLSILHGVICSLMVPILIQIFI